MIIQRLQGDNYFPKASDHLDFLRFLEKSQKSIVTEDLGASALCWREIPVVLLNPCFLFFFSQLLMFKIITDI